MKLICTGKMSFFDCVSNHFCPGEAFKLVLPSLHNVQNARINKYYSSFLCLQFPVCIIFMLINIHSMHTHDVPCRVMIYANNSFAKVHHLIQRR